MQFSQLSARLKTFLIEARRVLAITRKPSKAEFITVVKVTAVGMLIIGLIGFLLQLGRNLFL